MSVQIKTVEFERREAHLSELQDGPPWSVHGVALGAGDVTVGQSGIKKLWPAEELERAADSLEGRNLVVDHNNDSDGVVGRVTKAGYKEETGVIYEAELFDEDLAEKINNGLLEVSIRGKHVDVEQMEETDDGAKVVEGITFDNLSIVPTGAAPSNTIEMGETEELSVAELAEFTETLETAELQEIEPGMWVTDGDMHGITISQVQDGEIEVDVYEESDGKWRSVGETTMVFTDSLEEWDVDEEEDIGAVQDEEEAQEIPDDYFFESEEDAMDFIEDKDGLTGVHEMDDMYVPGDTHDEFLDWWDNQASQSKHKMDSDVEDDKESEQVDPPDFEEGMMVQWSVNPDMFGEVVHNPDDKDIIMVEVMEMMDGEMKPTGHTLTAAPPDLEAMNQEEMSDSDELETFSDYPEAAKENAQMALDAREETDNPNDCGTDVGWRRANQLASGEAVSRDVVAKMSAFNRHRQNSDMDDDEGKADCGWMMWKAWGGDEGVDWAMSKMDSMEEASRLPIPDTQEAELQELEVHSVDFSGTTESSWEKPAMEDFDADDLSEIDDHFLVSKTGFPPENYTDLALPVVEPNGELNLNALQNSKARGNQVEGLSGEDLDDAMSMINTLANENFEDASFEEEAGRYKRERTIDDTGDEPNVEDSGPVDIALEMINKYLTIEGNHERDSVGNMLSWLLGSVDIPMETLDDFRIAARRFIDETPGTDTFNGLTVEQFRDWLLMHGKESQGRREQDKRDRMPRGEPSSVKVLTGDDLQQGYKSEESELDDATLQVINMTEDIEQKLEELSEPVAVEQSDLEELQQKADRFEEMSSTLEDLKERTDILDEVDRDSVEELAEAEEPVVVESARMESLEQEAEEVAETYASELAEELGMFSAEELTDKFSIGELREKYEEHVGDPAEELASSEEADPKSGDVEEEELEDRAEEESSEEEELSTSEEEVKQKQEEIRQNILGD